MPRSIRTILAVALLAASGAAATVPGAARAADAMAMDHGAMHPRAARTPADRAFAAANDAMMKGMDVKPSGDPDRDFVAMMLPHHRGAVAMARVELRYGRDPVLRGLAARIVAAQEREIGAMRAWQRVHAR